MLGKIIAFELRYRFSKPMTYIFILLMIFQAIWYAKGTYDYYVNDDTFLNAAGIIYQSLAGGGMLMIIVIAITTGTALFKDLEFKTAETLYTFPVSEKTFIAGKFIAAYIVNLVICLAYAVGFTVIQYSGIVEADKFGPVPWGHLAYGYLIYCIPNMMLWTSVALSMVVFFRNMAGSYLAVFMLTMLFLVAESTRENSVNATVIYLMDPTAFTYTKDTIRLMTVVDKNFAYISFSGILALNRLLWIVISLSLSVYAFSRFSFKYFIAKPGRTKINDLVPEIQSHFKTVKKVVAVKVFSNVENFKKLFRLSVLEIKNMVRPMGFKILMGIQILMFFLYNILWNPEYYIHTDLLPLTSSMTLTRLPNGVFIFIIIAIWAGELLFKERTANIWQITDVLPVPNWLTYFSKFIAMVGICFSMAFVLFASGVLAQVVQGFFDIEWSLYLDDIFGFKFGFLTYLFIIALVFLLGGLTGNRFATHILSVFIILFIIISADTGLIEQLRFIFPFTPGLEDYSEMNGHGIYAVAAKSYALMWTALSLSFLLIGVWLWNRGVRKSFVTRLLKNKSQLHFVGKIAIVILWLVFVGMQYSVIDKEQTVGNFKTNDQQDFEDAGYEKRYKYIETQNNPFICSSTITIDISPSERKAEYFFTLKLTNYGKTTIDTLHFNMKDFVTLHSIEFNKSKRNYVKYDSVYNQYSYLLPSPLNPGDTMQIDAICTFQYLGFSTVDPQPELVFNGCLLENDILPFIGYNADRELNENRPRRKYGLDRLASRMDNITDSTALARDAHSTCALWHQTTIKIAAGDAQIPFASGVFTSVEHINDKDFMVFSTQSPSPMKWHIGCARYQEHKSVINNNVDFKILFDKRHNYNIAQIENAVKESIIDLEQNLGKYPYSQLSISEIPFYQDDFYVAPNSIAISEKHCWTADKGQTKDLSYIYFSICREIYKQWLFQNIKMADVQGLNMLLVAVPEMYALNFIENKFGHEVVEIYFEKKTDRYGKGRGNEPNNEPPLIYDDGADYLATNKGAIELYKLSKTIGLANISSLLNAIRVDKDAKNHVFADLYTSLIKLVPIDKTNEFREAFEKVL